jgi:protein arginine N-methyltransferase 1
MADRVRTEAFAKALRKLVKPGCTVLDIGSGTGFLAFLARTFGAGRCILIEREPEFVQLSKDIAKTCGITGCEFICADSRSLRKSIAADIIVSETLGNFAYEENTIETIRDARRFLRSGGIMIPQKIRMFAAPVVSDIHWKTITSWDRVGYGIDWSPARRMSINNMYVKTFRPEHLFPAKLWDTVELSTGKPASVRKGDICFDIHRGATFYGLCISWECTLFPGISIATHASAPATHWEQIFLPASAPLPCKKGDTLACVIRSDSHPAVKINVEWDFLTWLFELGRRRADAFLREHFDKLGHQSSVDIEKRFL